jgi:uncharacterized membrane protein (DUF106 family)
MGFIEWLLTPEAPGATITITLICLAISFANSSINRLLITRLVGWQQYKIMQKDISEYRSQTTQALRSHDKKVIEKLKKRDAEILNMQKKMARPQLVLFVLSFSYIFVWWFILGPTYLGNTVAFIPGIGRIDVFWWYFICSFVFGTVSSRLLDIMSIE